MKIKSNLDNIVVGILICSTIGTWTSIRLFTGFPAARIVALAGRVAEIDALLTETVPDSIASRRADRSSAFMRLNSSIAARPS